MNLLSRVLQAHPLETGWISGDVCAVKCSTVNFFIYRCNEHFICFDCGFGRASTAGPLKCLGIDPTCVTHVFLTHSDIDHAGGLALFKNATVYLSEGEVPMITRKKARMGGFLYNNKIEREYRKLQDDDTVQIGPDLVRAISTPGHTPGSMSYLVNDSVLFSGDTFKLVDGKVFPLRNYINMDTELQKESIKKLAGLTNVSLACTAHSGYTGKYSEAINAWKD